MSHYLIELYSPKPAWLALNQSARQAFFDGIGAGMGQLSALGIEANALGKTDASVLKAASQTFFALWRAPDATAIATLVNAIEASGWHDYFDTVNAVGEGVDLAGHLQQLAPL
ncbi:MAG: DUF6616 family protein [Asticcacaulis sp.]